MFPSLNVDRYARHVEKAVRSGVRLKLFWINELRLVSRYGARCELGLAPRSCNSEWIEEISRWERCTEGRRSFSSSRLPILFPGPRQARKKSSRLIGSHRTAIHFFIHCINGGESTENFRCCFQLQYSSPIASLKGYLFEYIQNGPCVDTR